MSQLTYTTPEILAPAGSFEALHAAVKHGADAVYFGLQGMNARSRAYGFRAHELADVMDLLHRHRMKGYVTLNTLIFQDEWDKAKALVEACITHHVDAVIVQDIGMCKLIRQMSPDLPIHGSTQMSITSTEGVLQAQNLGCELVVLARENSLDEITRICESLRNDNNSTKIETFVHGALCVAYSGQCLTSESFGGRSANRGQCAQSCRLPYDLQVDDKPYPLDNQAFLLSPQDLNGIEVVPSLMTAGVSSLKIEGRLKTAEYVTATVSAYRKAVDVCARIFADGGSLEHANEAVQAVSHDEDYALNMTFSRGFYTGWLKGIDNQRLCHGKFGKKRGALVGKVIHIDTPYVEVELTGDASDTLKAGNGLVFAREGQQTEYETGGFVHEINGNLLRFGEDVLDSDAMHIGQEVYKTKDPTLEKKLQQKSAYLRPVSMYVSGAIDTPMTLHIYDAHGNEASASSTDHLQEAQARPLNTEYLTQQLGRLGDTPYGLHSLEHGLTGDCFLPAKALNQLRRDAVDAYTQTLEKSAWRKLPTDTTVSFPSPAISDEIVLIPEVRTLAQAEAALGWGATHLIFDPENPRDFKQAGEMARHFRSLTEAPIELFLAPPRIYKDSESAILKQAHQCIKRKDADGILARNAAHLNYFNKHNVRMRGDFALNCANALTAAHLQSLGCERVTMSYDLNIQQMLELIRNSDANALEMTLHQHMPMFHMEHCVFCAFMTTGKDYRDCGRPCEEHKVKMVDRYNQAHLLQADAGCRNTLYNAKAQTGAEYFDTLRKHGLRHFRLSFIDEDKQTVQQTLAQYSALINQKITGEQLWQQLNIENQLGVTQGTLNIKRL